MNRREALAILIAGPMMSRELLRQQDAWLVVATRGWNRNQRAYTEESLDAMSKGLKGQMIMDAGRDLWPEEGDLKYALGVVTDSKRWDDGAVVVRVRWFTDKAPLADGTLTPTGNGTAEEKAPGWNWITSYTPSFLAFDRVSSFEGATRL